MTTTKSKTEAGVVVIDRLTKRFKNVTAVNDLSFTVEPGRVTGFLGPNGAGKTTTLRMLLGLVRPTAGTATIGGKKYLDFAAPMREVGAALEAASFHPGRSAINHLKILTPIVGVPDARAEETLAMVGLADVAGRRVGGFSLGMRQRLALAATMLGDPQVLLLDEPANGLDPEGIAWLRQFLRVLAAEGRTILVSSHMLSEVKQTVDEVVIISRGELVHASSLKGLAKLADPHVLMRARDTEGARSALAGEGWDVRVGEKQPDQITVRGANAAQVGERALQHQIELHELVDADEGLEATFFKLVNGQHTAQPLPGATRPVATGEGEQL
ncbi:MAG TPA: ATP-binding cassette domain-containing protein [Actinomycetales bacterium]|nr:ATP-binding cassette domain-containing protein [Actinomycetales bacterium]